MVEVIRTSETRTAAELNFGNPLIHIHLEERTIHGNHVAVKIFGEMKIAAKERVYAKELKLNTIQVLMLTVETGLHYPFIPQKWIYHKGEYDNYASIDILAPRSAYQYDAHDRNDAAAAPAQLPHDGSIWLNFIALGE